MQFVEFGEEVRKARQEGRAVVALESTIISHGMPYPQNYECAKSLENILREMGVAPAVIAVMGGKIKVGLSDEELKVLATEGSAKRVRKVSRRDLAWAISKKELGGTTVSGTMLCCSLAGIEVFATGGIGGVHRGEEQTMDISADLTELGRTRVAVVCAGVKSILDIPKTLQYLETQGVPVVTLGSQFFPAFFSASSGLKSPLVAGSTEELAALVLTQRRLGLQGGILIAVPNPSPQDGEELQQYIRVGLEEVREKGIKGAEVTPYLLARLNALSGGRSLRANLALVESNVRTAGALARLMKE